MSTRVPLTAAAALALGLIAATEVIFLASTEPLTGLPLLQPTADDATLAVKRELLPLAAGAVVLVGDSSCMMGLDPEVIGRQGIGPTINLGSLLNLTMAGFDSLGEEILRLPVPPKVIVMAVLPRSFEVTSMQASEFGLLGRYLVAYGENATGYRPTVEDRYTWFVLKHRVNAFPPEFGGSFAEFAARLKSRGGHFPEPGKYTGVQPAGFRRAFHPTVFARQSFVALAQAAERHAVPLIFWWSPSPRDAVSVEYLESASRYVEDVRSDAPALKIAGPAPAWDVEKFGSVTHVNGIGAQENSRLLGEYLSSAIGPR